MTVRRYSINSGLTAAAERETRPDAGWGRLQDVIQHGNTASVFGSPAGDAGVGRVGSRHSLQEYVHKHRLR